MPKYDTDVNVFLHRMCEKLSRSDEKQVKFDELGSFMNMDQNECRYAVAMLQKLGYVKVITGPSVIVLNEGFEHEQHVFGKKIDYDQLIAALESVSSSMTDFQDVIQPLIDEIQEGNRDDNVTRTKLWDIADRMLNSTVAATTVVMNLRTLFGAV